METKFENFGVMLDCSRNAVRTVESVKNFIDILSKMGYNMLQLYTEDTFEINNEKHFGYKRGRYSISELKELNAYAKSKNIELVPCIQTLAHLNQMFRWEKYSDINDCNDILLCDNPKTYELIEKMFITARECFSSNLINIGMDEAHMVGLGKYLREHGYQDRYSIILKHLIKVNEIAKKYNFKPMMWSDMFFRLGNDGKYYTEKFIKFSDDVINQVPSNLSLIYWDYYHIEDNVYDYMMKSHKQFNNDIWFAGGAWIWGTFASHNKFSIKTIKSSLKMALKNDIRNVFITMWGDNGSECSYYSVLPSLYYASCIAKGITSTKEIKDGFKDMFGIDFDKFLYLDLPDDLHDDYKDVDTPSKYILYSDLFMGFLDNILETKDIDLYKSYSKKLSLLEKNEPYGYIFASEKALCDVLYLKGKLGINTRKYYKENDKENLSKLINSYTLLVKKLEIFLEKFRTLWYKENKPHGFDVQEIRIGGLIQRVKSCKNRLNDFVNGKIDKIEELEEEIIDLESTTKRYRVYGKIASPNIL